MSKIWIAILVIAALVIGVSIGGSDSSEPAAKAAKVADSDNTESTDTTETAPEPTPEPDSDSDGTIDQNDFAPDDAEVQTKADSEDCEAKGINGTDKEGLCEMEGTRYKVVNADTTLSMRQMSVDMNSITYTDTIPVEYGTPLVGSFVVADVTITNNLDAPVSVDGTSMFELSIGEKTFTPDSDAMIEASDMDDNIIYDDVQPGGTGHGQVIFRVPARVANKMSDDGVLVAYQFSDAENVGYSDPTARVGIIRAG